MSARELFFLVSAILGGLAIFIFGMRVMTDGLRGAAGPHLRTILARTTKNRFTGVGLGTLLGFLVGSSAASVMMVGFVNAGLMTLLESIPPILGANIGTTISMQVVSLRLTDYSYFSIAVGLLVWMTGRTTTTRNLGQTLLGFGLLFLGLFTMSASIRPHRDVLAPVLSGIDGSTPVGMILGVGLSMLFTGIIQSSGATIAMSFALVSGGVYDRLEQTYPIVLGAHIGTCATALLGSFGTNIEARRVGVAHLVFNLFNVLLALAAAPLFLRIVRMTSGDLIHQTANLHTILMVTAALLALPMVHLHARLVVKLTPSRLPPPEPSFLDTALLDRPEKAIYAAIRELQRVARICARSLRMSADVILLELGRRRLRSIEVNETTVNDLKVAMKSYLTAMTTRFLSKRQSLIIQHLNRCMSDIERIGDHIDALRKISIRRNRLEGALVDRESLEWLFELFERTEKVLQLVIDSLDPDRKDFQQIAEAILKARDEYMARSIAVKADFTDKVASKKVTSIAGLFYAEYVATLDRIVKHAKSVALAEKQPAFWIKRKKLDRVAGEAPEVAPYDPVDVNDFLDKLQSEDYL